MKKGNPDDLDPVEPGCPHCGAMTAHPSSSRPTATATPKTKSNVTTVTVDLGRPDGEFAYDLFVTLMENQAVAVAWEKLPDKTRQVWTGMARGIERRTIVALLAERSRVEQESRR